MRIKHLAYLLFTAIVLTLISLIIVLLASGYRFDPNTGNLEGTGIIAVNSVPDGALVYINDVPKDATNTSVTNIRPGTYNVKIEKKGFVTWEKDLEVEPQLVSKAEALLIPLFPSFNPLTFTGVINPSTSPDNQKIVYALQDSNSAGLWMIDLEEKPFNTSREAQPLLRDTPTRKYSQSTWEWSPDSNSLLVTLASDETADTDPLTFLYDISANTTTEITNVNTVRTEWEEFEALEFMEKVATLSEETVDEIEALNVVEWSPNNEHILHQIETDDVIEYRIYNVPPLTTTQVSPTPNPELAAKQNITIYSVAKETNHSIEWFPDSAHLIISEAQSENTITIEIIESTGTNQTELFSGEIKDQFVVPSPNGSKVIVLTKFNPASESYNLYSINLR